MDDDGLYAEGLRYIVSGSVGDPEVDVDLVLRQPETLRGTPGGPALGG